MTSPFEIFCCMTFDIALSAKSICSSTYLSMMDINFDFAWNIKNNTVNKIIALYFSY